MRAGSTVRSRERCERWGWVIVLTSSTLPSDPPSPLISALLAQRQRSDYAEDPVGFVKNVLDFHPWSKQREMMEAVRDHPRVTVRSCHGVGKTATAARIALWFLASHPDSRVITTAPTWAQVEQLLWREIRSAVGAAHARGKAAMFPPANTTKLEMAERWFAIGLSTNEPERFQGHHADHLLLVVDEASGVDERIFQAAEGFLTAEGAKVLLIGNPTRVGGQFHRSFTTERARWHQITVNVFDSPNYTGENVPAEVARAMPAASWAEETQKAWGEQSPMYQVRVLGNFPDTGEDTVIPLGVVEAAQQRKLPAEGDEVIGCDVARFGDDETVIAQRVGPVVRIVEKFHGKPTTHTAARVAYWAGESAKIVIDDSGVGGGVTDQLRAEGRAVTAFNGGAAAHRPTRFPNRRSEAWFEAAAQLEDLDLDEDEQLAADLTAPKYSFDLKLRQVVEKKEETKKRLGRSPDRADAVLLTVTGGSGQGSAFMTVWGREIEERGQTESRVPIPSIAPGENEPIPLKRGCGHRWKERQDGGVYCVHCGGDREA